MSITILAVDDADLPWGCHLFPFYNFVLHICLKRYVEQDKVLRQVPAIVQTMFEHVRCSASFGEQENNPAPLFVGKVLAHVDALEMKDYSRTSKTFKDYIL